MVLRMHYAHATRFCAFLASHDATLARNISPTSQSHSNNTALQPTTFYLITALLCCAGAAPLVQLPVHFSRLFAIFTYTLLPGLIRIIVEDHLYNDRLGATQNSFPAATPQQESCFGLAFTMIYLSRGGHLAPATLVLDGSAFTT